MSLRLIYRQRDGRRKQQYPFLNNKNGAVLVDSPLKFAYAISRVLYSSFGRASIIYLRRQSLAASSNLPPDIGRATLNCRYTWSCNPRDVLPRSIATLAVGSYPAFSPLPLTGGHSLLRYYTLTSIKPLTCVVLYVARTFLPHLKVAAIERICAAKIQKIV